MSETTKLTPAEEAAFRKWIADNRIEDPDHPEVKYDYRGFFKATKGAPHPPGTEQHFPDTFKRHGHPTFSQESQYSKGRNDGGVWLGADGETFLPNVKPVPSHTVPSGLEREMLEHMVRGKR